MSNKTIRSAVCCVVFLVSAAAPAGFDEPADWVVENCVAATGTATTSIATGARCDLKNRKTGKCLVHETHTGQVDWNFASCTVKPRQMTITAKEPGAVFCGETVAIKLANEYFRKCLDPQSIGINVCSEATNVPHPRHFDWQFQGCTGQLASGRPVSLYNVSRKDSIVYASRSRAVDTCWSDKIKLGQCSTVRDK